MEIFAKNSTFKDKGLEFRNILVFLSNAVTWAQYDMVIKNCNYVETKIQSRARDAMRHNKHAAAQSPSGHVVELIKEKNGYFIPVNKDVKFKRCKEEDVKHFPVLIENNEPVPTMIAYKSENESRNWKYLIVNPNGEKIDC